MVDLTGSEDQTQTPRMLSATYHKAIVIVVGPYIKFVDLITEHEGVDRVPDFSGKAKKRRLGGVELCSSVYGELESRWAEIRVALHRVAARSILWELHLRCGFVGTPVGRRVA